MSEQKQDENRAMLDEQIAELVKGIRERKRIIEEHLEAIVSAKAELSELLEERGEGWADGRGYARLTEGGSLFKNPNASDQTNGSPASARGGFQRPAPTTPPLRRVEVK
ncbi:MAG: hypothetical protein SF029_15010 [bacterium]|nr:hypothetical protein [bacterium]